MVKRVSEAIKVVNTQSNKSIQFGISPPGIWKNRTSDASGSSTNGREAYYALFADSRTWIKNGWIDYIVPQIYWKIGHSKADYATLVKWWADEVKGTNVKLYIGQGIYTDDVATEITKQLQMNQQYPEIKGSMFFSLKDLLENRQSCRTNITQFYKQLGSSSSSSNTNSSNSSSNTTNNNTTTNNSTSNNTTTSSSNTNSTSSTVSQDNIGKVGIVNVSSLNIREGARTDRPIIKKITQGTKVKLLDVLNGWYKVQLEDDTRGWVSGEYITITNETFTTSSSSTTNNSTQNPVESTKPTQTTFPRTGVVNATNLNIREGAKVERPIVTTVSKGTKLTLLDELNGWYKVQLADGTRGWASKEFID